MNDDMREKLSAYLDGALPEAKRRDLESRLAGSTELRQELEALRAVSKSVKDLPKSPLPPGYMARLQARRARGAAERRDWVLLPHAYRPFAFALSGILAALVVWDRNRTPEAPFHFPYDAVKVVPESQAPVAQVDLSGRITAEGSGRSDEQARKSESHANAALQSLGFAARAEGVAAKDAPGHPTEFKEDAPAAAEASRAAAMSEQARSQRNEELIAGLEKEKQASGIAQIMPRGYRISAVRGGSAGAAFSGTNADMMEVAPEPPAQSLPSSTPALVSGAGKASAKRLAFSGAPTPVAVEVPPAAPGRLDYAAGIPSDDAGLVFTDGGSLSYSWTLMGMPGTYPAVDYWKSRAVLLKRSGTKILEVRPENGRVSVYFRLLAPGEASDPAKDRFAVIPLEPKPVSLILLPR